MKHKPDYDNFDRLVDKRARRWQLLTARDACLAKMIRKIMQDNNLEQYLWQANASDLDNGSTESVMLIRWTYIYPYILGDKQYDKEDEDKDQPYASIYVNVRGEQAGAFTAYINFDHEGPDGKLHTITEMREKAMDKTPVKVPRWFEPALIDIYTPNLKQLKKRP